MQEKPDIASKYKTTTHFGWRWYNHHVALKIVRVEAGVEATAELIFEFEEPSPPRLSKAAFLLQAHQLNKNLSSGVPSFVSDFHFQGNLSLCHFYKLCCQENRTNFEWNM